MIHPGQALPFLVTRGDAAPVSSAPAASVWQALAEDGQAGDLPLHVLLADEAMQAMLRSAGLTAATFRQQFQALAVAARHL